MARLGVSQPRTLGRRLRSAAVTALIVGAAGAFFPGGHAAHAASPHMPAINQCYAPVTQVNSTRPNASGDVKVVFSTFGSGITIQFNGTTDGAYPVIGLDGTNGCPVSSGVYTGSGTGTDRITYSSGGADYSCEVTDARIGVGPVTVTDPNPMLGSRTLLAGQTLLEGMMRCTRTSGSGSFTAPFSDETYIGGGSGGPTATPELGSGELLATGLVPALGIVLYRRRRQRRAAK